MIPSIRRSPRGPIAVIAIAALLALPLLMSAPMAHAQGKGNNATRDALRKVLQLQGDLAASLGADSAAALASDALQRLNTASNDEVGALDAVSGSLADLRGQLENLGAMVSESQSAATASDDDVGSGTASTTAGIVLTQPNYFVDAACPFGERNNDLTVFISEQALFTAETVREGASRVCDEVIAGFNTSLACLVTDAIYIVAKEVHNVLTFCDATVDSAEIEGCFERAADNFALNELIRGDLIQHDVDIKTLIGGFNDALAQHDADIKAAIAAHDAMIKMVIAEHDADIKARLTQIDMMLAEIKDLLITPPGRRPGFPLKDDIGNGNANVEEDKNANKNNDKNK